MPAVLKVWWAMIVFGIADIGGIISTIIGKSIVIPPWAWFVIAAIALFMATFLAFHKVRVERDKYVEGVDLTEQELSYLHNHETELRLGVANYGVVEPIVSTLMKKDMIEVQMRRESPGPRSFDMRYLVLTEHAKQVLRWADVMKKKEIHHAKT